MSKTELSPNKSEKKLKKLKNVKKAGQKKAPKIKHVTFENDSDTTKIKKKRDKVKKYDESILEVNKYKDANKEPYELTSNDIQQLNKPENKKNVVSKRQIKREKFNKLLEEQKSQSSSELLEKSWNYLKAWKNNKNEWKFQKVRQVWLTENLFNIDKVPGNLWEIVVDYFSGAQGKVRQTIIEQSTKIVEEMSDWIEQNDEATQNKTEFIREKPCEKKYNRAREMLQCLQE